METVKIQHVISGYRPVFPPRHGWNTRKKYDEDSLLKAIAAVLSGELSQCRAAKVYGVPQQTIFSRLKKIRSMNNQN